MGSSMATPWPYCWNTSAIASTVSASARVEISSQCCVGALLAAPRRLAAPCVLCRGAAGCAPAAGCARPGPAGSDADGILDLLQEPLVLVPLDLGAERLGQPLQQPPLLVREVGRRHDVQAHLQVAAARGAQVGNPLAAQAHRPAALRAGGDTEPRRLVERGDLDLGAERRLRDVDRQVEEQVVALAAEIAVLLHVDIDVQVARRAAGAARLALAGQPDLRAVVNARGHRHPQAPRGRHPPAAAAGVAGRGHDAALALAAVTQADVHELAEDRLRGAAQLAGAAAARTGGRVGARLQAAAATGLARLVARDLQLLLAAEDRLLEGQRQLVPQVGAALGARAPVARGRAGAEERLEDVLETEAAKSAEAARPKRRLGAHVAKAVIHCPLVAVAQHLVGLGDLLEALRRAGLLVAIRMVFQRLLAVGAADLLFSGVAWNA